MSTGRLLTILYTGADRAQPWTVRATADVEAARRRLRTVRRVDRVELTVDGGRVTARINGRRRRMSFDTPVSPAVALGLTRLGVRTTIRRQAR